MVYINFQIRFLNIQVKVKQAVKGEKIQHVIQQSDVGLYL